MIRNIVMAFSISIFSVGCTSTYKHSEMLVPDQKLESSLGVTIQIPEDGSYGNKQYQGSGQMTANALRSAFSKQAKRADIVSNCPNKDCLSTVDITKYGYLVKPRILHWEDRATEWSGIPDRVEIQILIIDTVTHVELANASYTGKSKWASFGGDHPQDLLPEPTDEYVRNLYQ